MFNDLVLGVLRVTSYLVLIVAALLALYVVWMGVRELVGRKPKPAARHGAVFAASEPEKRAPDSRDAGNRR